jgi:hypothetical protein
VGSPDRIMTQLQENGFAYVDCSLEDLLHIAHDLGIPRRDLYVKGGIAHYEMDRDRAKGRSGDSVAPGGDRGAGQ